MLLTIHMDLHAAVKMNSILIFTCIDSCHLWRNAVDHQTSVIVSRLIQLELITILKFSSVRTDMKTSMMKIETMLLEAPHNISIWCSSTWTNNFSTIGIISHVVEVFRWIWKQPCRLVNTLLHLYIFYTNKTSLALLSMLWHWCLRSKKASGL